MLQRITIPGIFVTGTDTEVGKTVVSAGIADHLRRRGLRVGACKPVATGCELRREGLVSPDSELLAHHGDVMHPLDIICPVRYSEPLAPAVAAERAGVPVDFDAIDRSLRLMSGTCDVVVVEGAGGVMVPIEKKILVRDLIADLGLPAVVVARAGLGTINHTLLTLEALRSRGIRVAGVVINRYPERASVAEETNPRQIERLGKVPVLAIVPEDRMPRMGLPPDILGALDAVDWMSLARG